MLRIVTQNIWGRYNRWQERAEAIGRNMDDLEVDIVCIQESDPDHFEYLESHCFRPFPHACYAVSDDGSLTPRPMGLAIFSRLPLLDTGKVDIGPEREASIPWMRIVQYATVDTPSRHSLTVFNAHLYLSEGQKETGINACVELMRRAQFAGRTHWLTGDFNIDLDRQPGYLAALERQGYVDLWSAKNGSETGYTYPLHPDQAPAIRIDGHFTQRVNLDRVVGVSLVNAEPVDDGRLLLSDHVGVMATFDLD